MMYSGWGLGTSPQSFPPPFTLETFLCKFRTIFDRLRMSTLKYCKRCDRDLPLSKFSKHKNTKDGLNFYCKECISEKGKQRRDSPAGVYETLSSGTRFYTNIPITITKEDFIKWYEQEPQKCIYCDIPMDKLYLLGEYYNQKHRRLTIDRKCSEVGYAKGNLALACNLCNLVKQDVLTFDEMVEIGHKYLKPKWIKKLDRTKTGEPK